MATPRVLRNVGRILLLFTALLTPAHAADEPIPAADARAVLERFVGHWQTIAKIHNVGPPERDIATRGVATCQVILAGEYFEFRTETTPPGEADLQIMTYDAKSGLFRQWVFSSDGYRHEATGTWNPLTATLAWKGTSPTGSFVIQDRWTNSNQLNWTLKRTDQQGRTVQTIVGTVSRAASVASPEKP